MTENLKLGNIKWGSTVLTANHNLNSLYHDAIRLVKSRLFYISVIFYHAKYWREYLILLFILC